MSAEASYWCKADDHAATPVALFSLPAISKIAHGTVPLDYYSASLRSADGHLPLASEIRVHRIIVHTTLAQPKASQ
jgi:hypothetical protein